MEQSQIISCHRRHRVLIVQVTCPRLSYRATGDIKKELFEMATGKPSLPVIFDISSIEEMSSFGLGMLVDVSQRLVEKKVACCIAGSGPQVRSIIEVTALDKLLTLRDSLDEGLNTLKDWMHLDKKESNTEDEQTLQQKAEALAKIPLK